MINIEQLVPQVGTLIIKHPVTGETEFQLSDGKKVQLILYLVGRNSPQWIEFMKELNDKGGVGKDELFSRVSDVAKKFIANQITGWENNGALKEEYSKENAYKLIDNPNNIWLMEQIQQFLLDETNFFLVTSTD